jgi:O-antigen ligase
MEVKFNGIRLLKYKNLSLNEFLLILYIISVISISMIPIGNIVSRLIGIVLLYVFAINVFIKYNKIYINREIILIITWFLFCILSGLVALNFELVVVKLITIFQLLIFFVVGYSVFTESEFKISTLLYLIIFSVFGIFVFGFIAQYNPDVLVTKNRITATAGDPNALSILGAFAYLFALYLFQTDKNKVRLLILIPIIVIIMYGVILTQSRQGILLVLIGTILYGIIQIIHKYSNSENKQNYILKLFFFLIVFVIVISIAVYAFQQTEYSYRIQAFIAFIKISMQSSNEHLSRIIDYSAYERRQLLKYGIEIWKDHPIFGIGLDNFRVIIKHYNPIGNRLYSHNNYIEILTTIGTLGAIVYYAVYISIFAKLFKLQKLFNIGSNELKMIQLFITILGCIMVIELVTVTYYSKFIWILLLIIVSYSDRLLIKPSIS